MTTPRLAALMLVACTWAPAAGAQSADAPVWPPPPAPARIRYLRALTPQAIRRPPSALSRFVRVLVGSAPEKAMAQPYGIAVGTDRRVYVADSVGGVVHVYDIERSDYSTIKVDAESLIGIVAVGKRLIVTDSIGGRVLCLDTRGRALWKRGTRDGFVRPTGIAALGDRLFVVDTMRHQVTTLALEDGAVLGSFGSRGSEPGQFNFPTNVVAAPDGRLFVTDTLNFRVQIFDARGAFQSAFGRLGDGTGDFDKPKGVALDSGGHVYVVEGLNDVVQVFDADGTLLLAFGGSGTGPGQFWLPSGITIANDVVYVADGANHRVQMFQYVKDPRP